MNKQRESMILVTGRAEKKRKRREDSGDNYNISDSITIWNLKSVVITRAFRLNSCSLHEGG